MPGAVWDESRQDAGSCEICDAAVGAASCRDWAMPTSIPQTHRALHNAGHLQLLHCFAHILLLRTGPNDQI